MPRVRAIVVAAGGGVGILAVLVGAVLLWGRSEPRPAGFAPSIQSETGSASEAVDSADGESDAGEAGSAPGPTGGDAGVVGEGQSDSPVDAAVHGVAAIEPDAFGVLQVTLDVRERDRWAMYDFVGRRLVEGDLQSVAWDIAFRRTAVRTNSGATNPDGVGGAANLGEVDLNVVAVPGAHDVPFAVDEFEEDSTTKTANPVLDRWYRYDIIRHIIHARPNVYLVRTQAGGAVLLRFDSYYCEDESPGCVTFSYRVLPDWQSTGSAAALPTGAPISAR